MTDLKQYFGEGGFEQPEDDGNDDYGLLPVDWYAVEISAAEVKETKSGSGVMLVTELTIIGDNYTGRKVWNNANILNASDKAQAIGQQQLGRMMKACGFGENERLTDENMLLGRQLEIRVVVEKGKDGYEDRNAVKKFRRLGDTGSSPAPAAVAQQYQNQSPASGKPAAAPEPAAGQQEPATKKRPWERS